MEEERERVRHNQLELTGQLQDFADTQKYVKIIEEINKKLERERLQQIQGMKEKRIQNEGKSYSAVQPEIRVNQAYFERTGKSYELTKPEINPRKEEEQSLARVTGKEFAESLRRRAAKTKEKSLEITDMSEEIEDIPQKELDFGTEIETISQGILESVDEVYQEETVPSEEAPEIHVDLDAEYFKWKEGEGTEETAPAGKKGRRLLFGRK